MFEEVVGGVFVGVILLVILVIVLMILLFIFWIWMIVDCTKRKFKNETEKIVWILVIVLAHFIGAIIYYFVVKIGNSKGIMKSKRI